MTDPKRFRLGYFDDERCKLCDHPEGEFVTYDDYDALRRLASSEGVVKVRELEWADRGVSEPRFKADAVIGTYYIERSKAGLFNWWTAATRGKIEVRTLDSAKAAAQADYEARIRSALVEVPAVKGEPEPVARIAATSDGEIAIYAPSHNVIIARFARGGASGFHDGDRLYTAPPADAGMREALESWLIAEIKKACERYQSGDQRGQFFYGRHSALLEVQQHVAALTAPGATTKSDEPLGRFGHHPIPADDFLVEVECIENEWSNVKVGFTNGTPTRDELEQRLFRAMQFRVGGDAACVDAKAALRKIEAEMHGPSDPSSTRSDVTVEEVKDTYLVGAADLKAMSGDIDSNRVIKLHFRRRVTDKDREWLLEAINLKIKADQDAAAIRSGGGQ